MGSQTKQDGNITSAPSYDSTDGAIRRWIFIIEGILTCVVALVSFLTLVEFPDRSVTAWRFLNQRELDWVLRRVNRDRGDAELEPFSWKKFLGASLDLRLWGLGVIFW